MKQKIAIHGIFRYTSGTMKIWVTLVVCFTLFFCTLPLAGASTQTDVGIYWDIGWYGSIPEPIHEDPLPIRSHLSFGMTYMFFSSPLSSHTTIQYGFTGNTNTRSFLYGTTLWRSSFSYGQVIELSFWITDRLSISPSISLLASQYHQTQERVSVLRIGCTPAFAFQNRQAQQKILIAFPLFLDVRGDYYSLSARFGLRIFTPELLKRSVT